MPIAEISSMWIGLRRGTGMHKIKWKIEGEGEFKGRDGKKWLAYLSIAIAILLVLLKLGAKVIITVW